MIKYVFTLLLLSLSASASLNEVDKAYIPAKNLLKNPGFENGKASWTPNDTGDFTTTTTSPMIGLVHALWDADASTDTLTSSAITIPAGLFTQNSVVSCLFKVPSGTATNEIQAWDGTNVLSTASIGSSTTPIRISANFVMPSSGTIAIRIYANADEPSVVIDDCYLGPADGFNLGSVSQAEIMGTATWPGVASCQWTSNGTFSDFAADTDCTNPTVTGYASAPATKVPGITFSSLPPGTYEVVAVFTTVTDASTTCSYRISDGTTGGAPLKTGSTATSNLGAAVSAVFTYTGRSSTTFQVQTYRVGSNLCRIDNDTATVLSLFLSVKRFPSATSQAFRPDAIANSWSGYHDNTCSWSRTNAGYGDPGTDASCALVERTNRNFGSVTTAAGTLPGIIFTPSRVGRYYVCATPKSAGGTLTATYDVRLWDGTTVIAEKQDTVGVASEVSSEPMCGIYVATTVAAVTLSLQTRATSGAVTIAAGSTNTSSIEWSIMQIDQSFPVPILVNSVVARDNSTSTTTINTVVSKATNYTATANDETIIFTADATLTLPAAASYRGKKYTVISSGSTTNVTIDPNASETICGVATLTLNGDQDKGVWQSDGTNWIGESANACIFKSSARVNCDAGSAIVAQEFTTYTVGNVSGGACAVTILSGTYSAAPYCTVSVETAASSDPIVIGMTTAPTTGTVSVDAADNAGGDSSSFDFELTCSGKR